MEQWLLLSLITAACWGIYNFTVKLIVGKDFLNSNIKTTIAFIALGILITFAAYFLFSRQESFSISNANSTAALLGIFLGIVWGVGTIIFLSAVTKGADVSRMAPVFNLSVLLTITLGIIFLRELPDKGQALRVIIGAALTIIGATLVAL